MSRADVMPRTLAEAVARARCEGFDLAGLTAGGYVTHLRGWCPEAVQRLARFGGPPDVTLEVVAETWPGRRGVRVAVLAFFRRPVAVLVLAGREGDDGAVEHVLDPAGLRAAERRINGWLPPRLRVGRERCDLVDVRRSDPRDVIGPELTAWAAWFWETERPDVANPYDDDDGFATSAA